jgi:hypothetical protein
MAAGDDPSAQETGEKQKPTSGLPPVDFSTFVLSMGTTALYQLGAVPDPATGERAEPDPLVAKQTIDTLEMLRDKTRGNLDDEERNLIDSLLYELQMRFVETGR